MILGADPPVCLLGVRSAFPEHSVGPQETAATLERLFPSEDPAFIAQLVERSGVERRQIALPVQEILELHGFSERNAAWLHSARDLATRAARGALSRSGIAARDVDLLIDVSCTGVAIPALDVELSRALGLRADVRRIPITESGCAAGALALAVAGSSAQHGERALVVAVELCSLTLVSEDSSRTNLVASALFGDGAAAAVLAPVEGEMPGRAGPRLVAFGSHLLPGTSGMMGFDVGTHGLRIVLQRELPSVLARDLRGAVEAFLDRHGREAGDVGLHLVHPGGRRILEAYAEIFELPPEALSVSHESLRRHGNLSSVSVLTLLEIALESGARPRAGTEALLVGVGPGLSLEMSLWSWEA